MKTLGEYVEPCIKNLLSVQVSAVRHFWLPLVAPWAVQPCTVLILTVTMAQWRVCVASFPSALWPPLPLPALADRNLC